MERRTRILMASLPAIFWILLFSGCSVFMAAKQPDKKNLDVLKTGMPHSVVLAEIGTPTSSEERDGARTEVYKFTQGYSTGAKVSRAFFHGAADVFTWGLWEVVGTPAEAYFSGAEMIVMVTYDRDDRVAAVKYFKGSPEE